MSRSTDRAQRGQFSLLYPFLVITNTSILLGSWCIGENPNVPSWVLPYCSAGILIGIYGSIALALMPFMRD